MSGPFRALVPVKPTAEMLVQNTYAAMLAISPGNALLSEILAARDYVTATTIPADRCNDLRLILDALAKLGPSP